MMSDDDPHGYIAFTKQLFKVVLFIGVLVLAYVLGEAAGAAL